MFVIVLVSIFRWFLSVFVHPKRCLGRIVAGVILPLGCRDYEIYEIAHDGIKDEVKSYHGSLIGESSMLTWFVKVYLSLGLLIRCV